MVKGYEQNEQNGAGSLLQSFYFINLSLARLSSPALLFLWPTGMMVSSVGTTLEECGVSELVTVVSIIYHSLHNFSFIIFSLKRL